MRLLDRIPPDAGVAGAGHRALMLAAAARLAPRRGRSARALTRALRTTALGRFSPEERAWIARIERRRREIAAGEQRTGARGADAPGTELSAACPYWSIPRVWGRLLMRLVRELSPASSLELGTGFGISAAYQAAALELNGAGRLIAMDREQELAQIARQGFSVLGLEARVEMRMGPIGETLEEVAAAMAPVDYAFIDAEHTEEATVENFERLVPHLSEGAVIVVDDIKTSDEMDRAWERIRRHRGVSLALGLRRVGVVVLSATPAARAS